jgi:hypothetical protein
MIKTTTRKTRKKQQARISRTAIVAVPQSARHHIQSIKTDGTYHISNRSRCVSVTKETIISTKGGKDMLIVS